MTRFPFQALTMIAVAFATILCSDAQREAGSVEQQVSYRTVMIEGISIFYREAGPKSAPTILLLHGLPSSSRMFQPLLTRLADNYHLVAPDYPGFGHSDWPDPKQFAYTFDHIAQLMNAFTQAVGLSHYTLYMQDYGGPMGFRMALAHPERVQALIVQDAVAHNEGLGANWATRRAFWADRAAHEEALRKNLLSLATTKTRHVGDDPNVELYDPDLWTDEFAFLNAPGQAQIQSDLFYDYRTNVDAYTTWQAWMRRTQPRLLVIWGKHDLGRSRRAGTLSLRCTECEGRRSRRGALCAGYQGKRDCRVSSGVYEGAEVAPEPRRSSEPADSFNSGERTMPQRSQLLEVDVRSAAGQTLQLDPSI
jgi:pimeloyl-ACP methyl ester carboxylesterase